MILLLADQWPSSAADFLLLALYLGLFIGVPVVGYVLLAVDIKAYYRRLRHALVVVSNYTVQVPAWVAREAKRRQRVPRCLAAFGLELPCSEADLLHAYRQKVKTMHPDLGGSRTGFLQLQRDFEEARTLLESLRNASQD